MPTLATDTARADLESQTQEPASQRAAPRSPKFVQINLKMYNNFLAAPSSSDAAPVLLTTQTLPDVSASQEVPDERDTGELVQAALTQSQPLLE